MTAYTDFSESIHLDPEFEKNISQLAGGGPEGYVAPGVGQMGNPDAGPVSEVLFAAHLGCQSSSLFRTLITCLKMLLRGEYFRLGEMFNQYIWHLAGIRIIVV